ncbi:MAG: glycosidase [Actinomycetota bacterium]|nr:glycosidase [Actinomycetota bacterium]
MGVYRQSGAPEEVAAFGSWLGRGPAYALDFLPGDTWSAIEDPAWIARSWAGSGYEVIYSVPMLPATGATLVTGATGAYDAHFVRLAQALVAHGEGDSIIRLGWELNGSWFPWAAQTDPAAFVTYWRRVVSAMRSVSGASFRFDWNVVLGTTQFPLERAYPGDAYVDFVTADLYDQSWYSEDRDNPAGRWQRMLTQTHGLDWLESFAGSHGKQIAFPEWGLSLRSDGNGGGDNPYFIERMHEWFNTRNVAYQLYFEHDMWAGEQHRMMTGIFPNAAARYVQLFGAAPAAPTDIQAEGERRTVLLSWDGPSSSGPLKYEIYRSTSSTGSFVQVGTTSQESYRDSEVRRRTTYYYRLKTVDADGRRSVPSATVTVRTQ